MPPPMGTAASKSHWGMAMPDSPTLHADKPLWPVVAVGLVAIGCAALFGLTWGSQSVGLGDIWNSDAEATRVARVIIWDHRLPQVIMAGVVGACLALAGLLLQSLLRNPLASPFTLGVAGGGALGAFAVISLEGTAVFASLLTHLTPWGVAGARAAGAFIGVLVTVGFVFAVARAAGGVQTVTLLLAGVTLNFICAAGVMLLQSISDFAQTTKMVRWSMGGFDTTASQVWPTAIIALLGFAITLPTLRHLDVLSVDDRTAQLLGAPVRRVRALIILGTAVMVGACLAVAGPIGFIGLIVPHTCRLIVGPSHRRLLPATAFGGAALLVAADALARGIPHHLFGRAGELPVGILTAALGGPFFLALLLGLGRRGSLTGGGA